MLTAASIVARQAGEPVPPGLLLDLKRPSPTRPTPQCHSAVPHGSAAALQAFGAAIVPAMPVDEALLAVLVVADDPWVRAGLATALAAEGMEVVEDADAAAGSAMVAVVDGGWAGVAALDGVDPEVPAVLLVADPTDVLPALRRGARGVLGRDVRGPRLGAAVRGVAAGVIVLDPPSARALSGDAEDFAPLVEPLTPRELQVLECLARGYSNRRTARELGIAESTVKFHVNAILAKLSVGSRTEAVVAAARRGLVSL
jgi:two-component system nitrate/nitrite response regulator NarL